MKVILNFGIGIAVAGVGATFVVLGLIQNNKSEMLTVSSQETWEVGLGIAPRRGGFAAGMSLRW